MPDLKMQKRPLPVFTNSSLTTFRGCRWEYYLRYVLGLTPARKADSLRIGGAFALGIEILSNADQTLGLPLAIEAISSEYRKYPEWCVDEESRYKYDIESATVCAMLEGWEWRYSEEKIEVVESEMVMESVFKVSGRKVILKGKLDQIANQIGKKWLKEFKTAGEDISNEAKIWMRLRNAPQTTIYSILLMGTKHEGLPIMYDYTRKPEIGPTKIPLLDEDGVKIVKDANGERVRTKDGKKWRESADKEAGYVLQTRPETPEEFHDRLINDMMDRPDYYFNRREIYRETKEIERTAKEIEQTIADILTTTKNGRWYRNPSRDCDFCRFNGPCLDGWMPVPVIPLSNNPYPGTQPTPAGFIVTDELHPELSMRKKMTPPIRTPRQPEPANIPTAETPKEKITTRRPSPAAAPQHISASLGELFERVERSSTRRIGFFGPGGWGKTTLAAYAPGPVAYLDLDNSLPSLSSISHLGLLRLKVNDYEGIRKALKITPAWDKIKTIVVDTTTYLEEIVRRHVMATIKTEKGFQATSIESYGYGKGYTYVFELFMNILMDLEAHNRSGRTIVMIMHDCKSEVPNPEGEAWLRFEPRLQAPSSGKNSIQLKLFSWLDHLLFCSYIVAVDQNGKGKMNDSRCIFTKEQGHCMAKSRDLPLAIMDYKLDENGVPSYIDPEDGGAVKPIWPLLTR